MLVIWVNECLEEGRPPSMREQLDAGLRQYDFTQYFLNRKIRKDLVKQLLFLLGKNKAKKVALESTSFSFLQSVLEQLMKGTSSAFPIKAQASTTISPSPLRTRQISSC